MYMQIQPIEAMVDQNMCGRTLKGFGEVRLHLGGEKWAKHNKKF